MKNVYKRFSLEIILKYYKKKFHYLIYSYLYFFYELLRKVLYFVMFFLFNQQYILFQIILGITFSI